MSDLMFRLTERHQRLDDQIRAEQAQRWPDAGRLAQLKRMKLAIKDRLARIMTRPQRTSA